MLHSFAQTPLQHAGGAPEKKKKKKKKVATSSSSSSAASTSSATLSIPKIDVTPTSGDESTGSLRPK